MIQVQNFNENAKKGKEGKPSQPYKSIPDFFAEIDQTYKKFEDYKYLKPRQYENISKKHERVMQIRQNAKKMIHILECEKVLMKLIQLMKKPVIDPVQMQIELNIKMLNCVKESEQICQYFEQKKMFDEEKHQKLIQNKAFFEKKINKVLPSNMKTVQNSIAVIEKVCSKLEAMKAQTIQPREQQKQPREQQKQPREQQKQPREQQRDRPQPRRIQDLRNSFNVL